MHAGLQGEYGSCLGAIPAWGELSCRAGNQATSPRFGRALRKQACYDPVGGGERRHSLPWFTMLSLALLLFLIMDPFGNLVEPTRCRARRTLDLGWLRVYEEHG
jgi:hypothetical protein